MSYTSRSYEGRGRASARNAICAALALLGMVACGVAAGQDRGGHPALQDRWSLTLGLYVPSVDTTAFLNSTALTRGTELSFEDELGFSDRKAMPAILASVRLGERWRLEAEYLTLHRSSSRAINRTINWGDQVYTIGTVVGAEFDSDIYRLSAGYSFIKDGQKELGVALGLHMTDFKVGLGATGVGAQSGDALAPLPTIGLYGAYAFTPKWLLSGRADYFSMNYNDYDGSLVNFNVGVDYRFTRHFAVGLGYRHVDYEVDVTRGSYNGGITYKFSGPLLYVTGSF